MLGKGWFVTPDAKTEWKNAAVNFVDKKHRRDFPAENPVGKFVNAYDLTTTKTNFTVIFGLCVGVVGKNE